MNEARKTWEQLGEKCAELGLPAPVLRPSFLSDAFELEIEGYIKRFSRELEPLMMIISVWLRGYEEGKNNASEEDSSGPGRRTELLHDVFVAYVGV